MIQKPMLRVLLWNHVLDPALVKTIFSPSRMSLHLAETTLLVSPQAHIIEAEVTHAINAFTPLNVTLL